MEDIYALLGISESTFQDFRLTANRLVDHQTELTISRNIRTLQEYEVRVLSDKGVTVPQQTIDEIIQKVIENAKNRQPDDSIFSVRELRIISYYLILLQSDTDAYDYALSLLDRNWRSLYFNGLSFYCLETWNLIDPPLRIKTCNLLTTKLKQYSDDNKKYVTLRNHMNLFEEAGPKRLALLLTTKGQDIKDATSYFYNRPSTLCQSYYSDVIINYLESMNVMDLDYIQSILNLNQSDRTKKLVMAGLVERVNEQGDDFHRSQLCKFANRTLGDITLLSTWAPFSGATEADASKLQRARQLVNLWFNQKIIETFFEVCVQDRDRKDRKSVV